MHESSSNSLYFTSVHRIHKTNKDIWTLNFSFFDKDDT
jgi:hypothetical protein